MIKSKLLEKLKSFDDFVKTTILVEINLSKF